MPRQYQPNVFYVPKRSRYRAIFLKTYSILTVSRGHTSLTDIRAVRGIQCGTYNDTAITLGLCESDAE